jgi:hypothetical protein
MIGSSGDLVIGSSGNREIETSGDSIVEMNLSATYYLLAFAVRWDAAKIARSSFGYLLSVFGLTFNGSMTRWIDGQIN